MLKELILSAAVGMLPLPVPHAYAHPRSVPSPSAATVTVMVTADGLRVHPRAVATGSIAFQVTALDAEGGSGVVLLKPETGVQLGDC
jgi:hypothetical protein